MAQHLANMLLGGNGPVNGGASLYGGGQAQVMGSDQFHMMNVNAARNQRNGVNNMGAADQIRRANEASNVEQAKQTMTQIMQNLAGQGNGRGVPAVNKYQAEGRDGLVDPGMTNQQSALPIPFDRQWDLASNLQAYVKSLPPETFQMNEQIKAIVDQTVPQAQPALVQRSTIYEKVSPNPMVNRLNIALQRKREQSIYAVV